MKIIRVTAMWCMSCLVMKKTWGKVFGKYPDIIIEDYDFDDDEEFLSKYNLSEVLPVLIFIENDTEVLRVLGEKSEKQLNKIIEDLVK
ncbi:MAG: thioredoxin domain-containing protein [Candidatus Izemoplasmatales bacterium]